VNAGRVFADAADRQMTSKVNVPEELYQKAAAIARAQKISVDELFTSVFSDYLEAFDRLRRRAARGDRKAFLSVLDRVPDREPAPEDRT
jgi:hypothetical protein